MNKHDSERVAGLLSSFGATYTEDLKNADIVVFLTCCVREGAENRLLGHVNSLSGLTPRKGSPINRRIVAVGGCMGQRDGENMFDKAPCADVVFGTQNIHELPYLIAQAIESEDGACNTINDPTLSALGLPSVREKTYSAWLPIMTGCDNFCTYCIVPYVRGRERSRPLEDITKEASLLVKDGVKEITLLGQNVNSYGRDLYGEPQFAKVLRSVDETGIERLRFVTSHPKDLTDEVIELFGTLDSLMPALHLPVQSGSDEVLSRMNRKYDSARYMSLITKLRKACPDIALSTDVIVGFPGESEEDFNATLELVEKCRFTQVFTFIYSPRSGTPAANYSDTVSKEVAQKRFDKLFSVVETGALKANRADEGKTVKVLIEGTSKKDASMMTGRSEKNQTVHVPSPSANCTESLIGQIIDVQIKQAKTWYLMGEAQL